MEDQGRGKPASGSQGLEGDSTVGGRPSVASVEWARRVPDVTVPQDPWKCGACGGVAKYGATCAGQRDRLCARCYRVLLRSRGLAVSQSYRREWTREALKRLGRRHHVHETRGCRSCELLARGHEQHDWLLTRCRKCGHLLYGQSGHDCSAHHAVVYQAFRAVREEVRGTRPPEEDSTSSGRDEGAGGSRVSLGAGRDGSRGAGRVV